MARLRTETRTPHEALEELLDRQAPWSSRPDYERLLAKMLGIHAPLEMHFASIGIWQTLKLEPSRRTKADRFAADLFSLGRTAGVDQLPGRTIRALCMTTESALGCAYVLEGSTLGGQIIARRLQAAGLGAYAGCFHPYGAATGAMWREFGQALDRFAALRGGHDQIIDGANRAFATFSCWLDEEGDGAG